jgi:hypothetical protein
MGYNKKIDMFAYLMWQIFKNKIEPEYGYWQTKCWGGWICDDKSLICNKIRWVLFSPEKERRRRRRNGGGMRGSNRL